MFINNYPCSVCKNRLLEAGWCQLHQLHGENMKELQHLNSHSEDSCSYHTIFAFVSRGAVSSTRKRFEGVFEGLG